jgi:glycosyltransferase involved in cell wall biosynthesis
LSQTRADHLSVIVIAGAEQDNIAACLESVSWAGEIVVVYSDRTDATAEIARKYTDRVHFREFDGYASQRQAALSLATCSWILGIDADERITPGLREEILEVLKADSDVHGYYIPRKNFYREKWIRYGGWYPDHQLRLFRSGHVTILDRLVHESYMTTGKRGYLKSPMLHYTMPSVRHRLRKNLDYSLLEAREKRDSERVTLLSFIFRPPYEFFSRYVLSQGFLDGWEGFILAVIHALNKAQVLLYLLEMQSVASDPDRDENGSQP